ncbi:GNAT family N-acetyltransferase [Shewanella sp. A25]|nr:GNAT family N-acetyltransferase [Shewanella shenzhenensis]
MNTRLATLKDVDVLAVLEKQFLNDELSSTGGNLKGQSFNKAELTELVNHHWIMLAEDKGQIIGYVIAGRWSFFEAWPIYRNLLNRLSKIGADASDEFRQLTKQNSCQYGPIWVNSQYRGQGVFEALVEALSRELRPHFRYMVTFIAEENERSFAAHTRKASMQVLDYFGFSARDYYLMAARTE